MKHGLSLAMDGVRNKGFERTFGQPTPRIAPGTIIGNYRFGDLIGVGGFGEVYRAENTQIARSVAIKVYETRGDADALRAFKRGANYLAQLNHRTIVRMYDFFTNDEYALMVMELLSPDATLRALVGSYRSSHQISQFIRVFSDVLDAMKYCHQVTYRDVDGATRTGIYHGDIKPDNIFLDQGQIKIADFMIPSLEPRLSQRAQPSFPYEDTRAYGTPMYMSPEQLGGIVNEQTDIYNIGVTAYELLTGFYPYDSEADYHQGSIEDPATFCSESPDWLNSVITRCVANDAAQRYRHVAEIERDISKSLQNVGRARPAGGWLGGLFRRNAEMPAVFLSYRRNDTAAFTHRLYEQLVREVGTSRVFMDIDNIDPGEDFVEKIERAVRRCRVMLVIVGRSWLSQTDESGYRRLDNPWDYVRLEVSLGLNHGIRVIPVLADGAAMPEASNLPENLRPFARLNAVQVREESFARDTQRLTRVFSGDRA